jgi:tetrapyrrole methylase family protein/MazG family protein
VAHFDPLLREIRERYGEDCQVLVWRNEIWEPRILSEIDREEPFAIRAISEENPGGLPGLVWLVDRLLGPGGCPWDQAQTHSTLKKYLIEEAYELIDAIDRDDESGLKEELGDVMLQPIMHGQIKAHEGRWGSHSVADETIKKLIYRHPHVFGQVEAKTESEVLENWDRLKKSERGEASRSILEGIPRAMPALSLALEVSKRAARAGFEWGDLDQVWEKVREEEEEIRLAVQAGNQAEIADELGDLLFTIVNIARWLRVDPEDGLRRMVDRFMERFQAMERLAKRPLDTLTPGEWDDLWNQAKTLQKSS